MEFIFGLDEIDSVAKQFQVYTAGNKIFTFEGDLGSGKTTFINSVCKSLGVRENVTSPTYSLIHEYETSDNQPIYHMDFYRLNSLFEAINAGIEECISSGEYCMIEWPSKIENLLPEHRVKSNLSSPEPWLRKLVVQLP